ncbi:hypothetical protein F4553_000373 [Allocatelliglobosispora scoriae]|uniref:Uncharacterized protein n=1 Tax=Allocatelliglobosispora scoriae TaxID=643052 RepID=A0A841BFC4_9ACTN|nr:hypothetical protein [Allocatelliglobosispora scoriae]MBB5866994.1 hypothetical protein [Allocatelliglobosispora scoriae]
MSSRRTLARLATIATAGAAMAVSGIAAPAQAASVITPNANCPGYTTWSDTSGPGGGARRHVQCNSGYYVQVEIYCNTGNASSPGFRNGYNKAECPGYGGRATGGWGYSWY